MARVYGGGDRPLGEVSWVPDATFETEIDALVAAGTAVIGKLVTLTGSNNYEVTSGAAAAVPNGKIIDYRVSGSSYRLTVDMFTYVDQNGFFHAPTRIVNLPYDGTTALGDTVKIDDSDYVNIEDGGATGMGYIVAVDVPTTGRADFMV